jgi:hypothetical protein
MSNKHFMTLWWTRQHHHRRVKNNIQAENSICSLYALVSGHCLSASQHTAAKTLTEEQQSN